MVRIVEFKVTGVLKTMKRFEKVERFVRMEVPHLTMEQAEAGVKKAVSLAPVDTGMLVQAIGTHYNFKDKGWSVVSRTPGNVYSNTYRRFTNPNGVPYHRFMEEGTIRGNNHYFFMRDTGLWLEKTYPQKIREKINKVIK